MLGGVRHCVFIYAVLGAVLCAARCRWDFVIDVDDQFRKGCTRDAKPTPYPHTDLELADLDLVDQFRLRSRPESEPKIEKEAVLSCGRQSQTGDTRNEGLLHLSHP